MNEQKKLVEAKYFYSQMLEKQNQRDEFIHNLSAFLSASRSILVYALNEAESKHQQSWYDKRVDKPVIRFFTGRRNSNIHAEPLEADAIQIITFDRITDTGSAQDVNVNLFPSSRESKLRHVYNFPLNAHPKIRQKFSTGYIVTHYTFNDWPGSEDALTLCAIYLKELESIIQDGISSAVITG